MSVIVRPGGRPPAETEKSETKIVVEPIELIEDSAVLEAADEVPAPPTEDSPETEVEPSDAPTEPEVSEKVDTLLITVNGFDITESQVEQKMKPMLQQVARQIPPQFIDQYKQKMK